MTNWNRILTSIAENQAAHETGVVLTFRSGLLHAVALVRLAREGSTRLAGTGQVLAVVGGFGLIDVAQGSLIVAQRRGSTTASPWWPSSTPPP